MDRRAFFLTIFAAGITSPAAARGRGSYGGRGGAGLGLLLLLGLGGLIAKGWWDDRRERKSPSKAQSAATARKAYRQRKHAEERATERERQRIFDAKASRLLRRKGKVRNKPQDEQSDEEALRSHPSKTQDHSSPQTGSDKFRNQIFWLSRIPPIFGSQI